jgi:hypothetical protein
MCGSVHYSDAETIVLATSHAASSKLHRATSAKRARRNDQHSLQEVGTNVHQNHQCQQILESL